MTRRLQRVSQVGRHTYTVARATDSLDSGPRRTSKMKTPAEKTMDEGYTTEEKAPGESTRGHIFIIDEDPYSAELLEATLKIKGYRVQSVTTAAEARVKLREEPPDLILLDLHLPDSDGLSLM